MPNQTCNSDPAYDKLDPGAIFRIDPLVVRARLKTEQSELQIERYRLQRKLFAYEQLIGAMVELRELGEADFG